MSGKGAVEWEKSRIVKNKKRESGKTAAESVEVDAKPKTIVGTGKNVAVPGKVAVKSGKGAASRESRE